MNYKLINETDPNISAIQQILLNRGFKTQDINHYLNTTDEDILDPSLITNIDKGVKMLVKHISAENNIMLFVD